MKMIIESLLEQLTRHQQDLLEKKIDKRVFLEYTQNLKHLANKCGHDKSTAMIGEGRGASAQEARSVDDLESLYNNLIATLHVDGSGSEPEKSLISLFGILGSVNESERARAYREIDRIVEKNYPILSDFARGYIRLRIENRDSADRYPSVYSEINSISSETINTIKDCIASKRSEIRSHIKDLHPHDFYYFPSSNESISIERALDIIKDSLKEIDPEIPAFIDMMHSSGRLVLEGDISAGEASCLNFLPNELPVILFEFQGHFYNVVVLAHEIGHAFHYYSLMKSGKGNKPIPRCLIELPSILFEQQVLKYLQEVVEFSEAAEFVKKRDSAYYLLEFAARYDLETEMFKAVESNRPFDFRKITKDVYSFWFGKHYEESNAWITRPHFYMYDYPMNHLSYLISFIAVSGVISNESQKGSRLDCLRSLSGGSFEGWCNNLSSFSSIEEMCITGVSRFLKGEL